jgi:hypothetical protein
MSGTVYLLCEEGDYELYKIGCTRGDVNKRIKSLQTGNGNKIRCINTFHSNKPYRLETMLHNHFATCREEGEWFLLNKEQVDGFPILCEKFQTIIDSLKDNPYF